MSVGMRQAASPFNPLDRLARGSWKNSICPENHATGRIQMNIPTTRKPGRRKAIRRQHRRKADNVCRLEGVTHDSGWNSNRSVTQTSSPHIYEIRPRKDRRGFDLISDRLPLGLLWFEGPDAIVDAVIYARSCSFSHPAIIRVFDESGAVVGTHESAGR
jgi:hypothetical protein